MHVVCLLPGRCQVQRLIHAGSLFHLARQLTLDVQDTLRFISEHINSSGLYLFTLIPEGEPAAK